MDAMPSGYHEIVSHGFLQSRTGAVLRDRSKLPPQLGADAEVVLVATLLDLMVASARNSQARVRAILVAHAEAVLRSRHADAEDRIAEGCTVADLEHELLIQIEEILQADRAGPGVGALYR